MGKETKQQKEQIGIRQMAKLLDISQSALRYYESQDLISSVREESSNYRNYSYLTLIELTDIVLCRNLGIPMKKLHRMLNSSVEEAMNVIEETIDETEDELEKKLQVLRRLKYRRRQARDFFHLKEAGYQIVDTPDISAVMAFEHQDPELMRLYINAPDKYIAGVYFAQAAEPQAYTDCFLCNKETASDNLIWEAKKYRCRYLECLLKADYAYTENNNLKGHVDYMKQHGLKAGLAVGEYLLSEYSAEEQKRYEYYHLWIQILDS